MAPRLKDNLPRCNADDEELVCNAGWENRCMYVQLGCVKERCIDLTRWRVYGLETGNMEKSPVANRLGRKKSAYNRNQVGRNESISNANIKMRLFFGR